ncbi:MAG: rRNA maturation RNase YbeY [Deltaproteobacteria bacterium]|jgi:probable rRNA maturation factor|nr:rRNA maturation RNase YbeY [Deltaproteobacteria bacterium]
MSIFVIEENDSLSGSLHKLRRRLGAVVRDLGYRGHSLTVLLTDDAGIRRINREFRGIDESTNVLSFPDTGLARGLPNYLGDIALSVDTLRRESQGDEKDLGYLLYFYLIHGLLHLLGFDHEKGTKEDHEQEKETIRLMSLIRHDL